MDSHIHIARHASDIAALVVGVSAFLGLISPIMGFVLTCLGIAWYILQFRDRNKRQK